MRNWGLLCLMIILTKLAPWAQIDTPRVSPNDDVRDLAQRASASDFVVVGTAVTTRMIWRRIPSNDQNALKESISSVGEGQLFEFRVDEFLCKHSDFVLRQASPPGPANPGMILHIFVPENEARFDGPYRQEYLLPGHRYLLFVKSPPPDVQKNWTSSLQLDANESYFRTLGYSRGAIELPSMTEQAQPQLSSSPVLKAITPLCRAVSKSTLDAKLLALKELEASKDPVLQSEAEAARLILTRQD